MALFKLTRTVDPEPRLPGEGLYLRPAAYADFAAWSALRERSRSFLTPWEPSWPDDDLTRTAFRRRLKRYAEEMACGESYAFLIFDSSRDALVGGLTIGAVRRGVAQTGTLGYWMGEPYACKGYMTRAVGVAARWAFQSLRLHRLEAACLPNNAPSRTLLERNGFAREGLARGYLKINGAWQDHLLYAILETEADRLV